MEGNWAGQARQLNQGDLFQYIDAFLGGGQLGLGYLNSDRNYGISLAQLGLDQQKIDENARQFNVGQAWDMEKFAKTMGFEYKKLDLDSKIAMTNAGLRQQELNLAQNKYNDEKDRLAIEKDRERLSDVLGAYGMIQDEYSKGTDKTLVKQALTIYKDIYGDDVYKDLESTLNSLYGNTSSTGNPAKKTGIFRGATYNPPTNPVAPSNSTYDRLYWYQQQGR